MSDVNRDFVLDWLWRYGHFRNPQYPGTADVQEQDLSRLELSHPLVKQAVQSIQSLDINLVPLVQFHHGRAPAFDGEIGVSTLSLMTLPRCSVPDYGDKAATGSGSWPVGCDPERPDVHSVRVALHTGQAPARVKGYLPEAMANVERMSAEIGVALRHLVDGDPRKAEMLIRWERQRGNIIGWNEFPTPNTCRQTINGRLDTNYAPDLQLMTILMAHEYTGHGFGGPHTRGGIMNPSILRVPLSWKNDPSMPRWLRYFGGEPIDPPTPDPDPAPPKKRPGDLGW